MAWRYTFDPKGKAPQTANCVTPIQYLVNPGGNTAVPNALAIGVNMVFNF
jgi:hypothetical protein